MTKFKCKLQRLLEISPVRTDTGTKSWTPLVDRVVDDALLHTVPHVNQTLQMRCLGANALFVLVSFSGYVC